QFGIDQRVEDRTAIALHGLHDLFHLAGRAHQRPDMLLHEHALILHEAGTGHARHRLTRRVGHEMDVEVSVGHGLSYPTVARGETRDWPWQDGDRRADSADGADSGHDSPGPLYFSSSADRLGGMSCESGIRRQKTVESALADPQHPGDA